MNLVYGSAIAALVAIPQMIVYTIMQRRVSRTGGDYVWLSRSLGGFLGRTDNLHGHHSRDNAVSRAHRAVSSFRDRLCEREHGQLRSVCARRPGRKSAVSVLGRVGDHGCSGWSQHTEAEDGIQDNFDILDNRHNLGRALNLLVARGREGGARGLHQLIERC